MVKEEDMFTKEFREKTNNKLDVMIAISLLYCKLWDNWKCDKCGITQGTPLKGYKKYYCEHIGNKVDRFLNPISKRITQEILVESNEFI